MTTYIKKVKNYRILEKIGKGSFADIYMVFDETSKEIKAMKQISKLHLKNNLKLKELIKQEVDILKSCNSVNVIKFYEWLETYNNIYIILEYCKNGDMSEFLNKQPNKRVSEEEALNILKQLLSGFQALHKIGAMHRDFKPSNVLLDNKVFKICDLGFGIIADLTKTVLGTINYMAPEIIENQEYNSKVDIWSLGVVLYEMLFGINLFWGINEEVDLFNSDVKISKECKDLLSKMIERDPKNRISWGDILIHPVLAKVTQANLKEKNQVGKMISGKDINLANSLKFYENFNEISNDKQALNLNGISEEENLKNKILKNNSENEEIEKNIKVDFPEEEKNNYIEILKNQNTKQQNQEIYFTKIERRYLYIRNLLNYMVKIIMSGFAISSFIIDNYGYLIFLKKITRYYESMVSENFKETNLFSCPKFKIFSKSEFFIEYFEFLKSNLYLIQVQLSCYIEDLVYSQEETSRLFNDMKRILEKISDDEFNKIFQKIMMQFIKDISKYSQKIIDSESYENIDVKKNIIQIMIFLDSLEWKFFFPFDEDHEYGFDFDKYEENIKKMEGVQICERIIKNSKLILKNNDFMNFNFDFLIFKKT